jgi:hypothetical protein
MAAVAPAGRAPSAKRVVGASVNESSTLTNSERRENVAFLQQALTAARHHPTEVLDLDERQLFEAEPGEQARLFFKLLCFGALAAQPAPEPVVDADWRRILQMGVVDALFADDLDIKRYALDPPVSRNDSKGKVIDFLRLAQTRDTWSNLLPQPSDADTVVDVLHATSGGALKSRAFWVVREMRRYGLWHDQSLDPFSCVPDGRVRKRAVRMGLIDLPEKADSFADMKAVSRALHAALLLGDSQADLFDLPVSLSTQRCEVCDSARMATCALPHCRWRREHSST